MTVFVEQPLALPGSAKHMPACLPEPRHSQEQQQKPHLVCNSTPWQSHKTIVTLSHNHNTMLCQFNKIYYQSSFIFLNLGTAQFQYCVNNSFTLNLSCPSNMQDILVLYEFFCIILASLVPKCGIMRYLRCHLGFSDIL